MCPTSNNAN